LKARDNPFAVGRVERLAFRFPSGDGWESLLARLEANAWRGAIIGPHGAGKTTLLEQLALHLAARGVQPRLHTLRAESTAAEKQPFARAAALCAPEFLLLDGAEQLNAREWCKLESATRHAAGVVITAHSAGRLPTILEATTTPALLDELAIELGSVRLKDARELFQRHRGNIRDCLRELYDRCM
jgi:hypothetical protein